MQAIGVFGETIMLLTFPGDHPMIEATAQSDLLFLMAGGWCFCNCVLVITRQIRISGKLVY